MPGRVRIVIVEDESGFREMLEMFLEDVPRLEVCGSAGTLREARKVLAEQKPDVVLLDYELADGKGIELIEDDPSGGAAYLVLTGHTDPKVGRELLIAGARGFMSKLKTEPSQMVRAIQIVATEGVWLPDGFSHDDADL